MACIPDFTKDLDRAITNDLEKHWRNEFAGIALSRLMERETAWPSCGTDPKEVARQARVYADALITELKESWCD